MYKMMKVFDCQAMPYGVRKAFFESVQHGNDCLVTWCVDSEEDEDPSTDVTYWLFANGANIEDGSVVIKYWW